MVHRFPVHCGVCQTAPKGRGSKMRTRDGAQFTVETVERALTIHADRGRILRWERVTVPRGNRWTVDTTEGSIELGTLREAYAFVYGLASAAQAVHEAWLSTYNKGE